jgi:hypothetical protein
MRSFSAVTTCHQSGYEEYGRRMLRSFDAHFPAEVPLYFYAEGFTPEAGGRIVARDLLASSPGLAVFKARHANNPAAHGRSARKRWELRVKWHKAKIRLRRIDWGLGHGWDAVRFSHKSFAIFDAARHSRSDVLFWIDADVFVFADVPAAFLDALMPSDCLVSFLARPVHSECGFVGYNLRHPAIRSFLADFEALYTRDTLFRLRGTNDCYAFDAVRRRYERRGCRTHDIARGLGRKSGHVFVNSELGRYMDHLKGDRKERGASEPDDLLLHREEGYWQRQRSGPAG